MEDHLERMEDHLETPPHLQWVTTDNDSFSNILDHRSDPCLAREERNSNDKTLFRPFRSSKEVSEDLYRDLLAHMWTVVMSLAPGINEAEHSAPLKNEATPQFWEVLQ